MLGPWAFGLGPWYSSSVDHAPSALPLTESPGAPALVVPRSPLLPRWSAVVQAFLVCGILPTQLAIAMVLVVFLDVPMLAGDGAISLHFLATLSLLDTALVALLIRVFLILSGEESRDVFLGRRPIWGEVWRGLALVPVVLIGVTAIVLVLRAVAPWLQTVKESPISQYMQNPYDAAIFLVVGVLAASDLARPRRLAATRSSSGRCTSTRGWTSRSPSAHWGCSGACSISSDGRR